MKAFTLVGVDGNAWSVMGFVVNAMRDAYRQTNSEHFNRDEQKRYQDLAMSKDYNHLLCVSAQMIERVNEAMGLENAGDCPDCEEGNLEDGVCDYCGYEE